MMYFPKSFTRKEKWLLQTAVVMGYAINPVERFYNHDDWYLDSEIYSCLKDDGYIILSCEELKDLRSKPALTQSMDYSRTETVTRLTKAGWKKAYELAYRWIAETENYWVGDYTGADFWLWLDNA